MSDIKGIIAEDIMSIIIDKNIMEIDKPMKGETEILRINQKGFLYKIGDKNSKKSVSKEELMWAINKLKEDFSFTKKEYEVTFTQIAKSNPCNFTSIGGMLSKVINLKYSRGKYSIK